MIKSIRNKSPYELLKSLSPSDKLLVSDIAELYEFMNKESKVKEVIDLSKIKNRPDGRCYIYLNRKQFISSNKTDLINKLYDHLFGCTITTLEDLYPHWQIWRRDKTKAKDKTIKENTYLWNAYYKDSDIVSVPIAKLKTIDFINFFEIMTNDGTLTRKRFNDIKSILNNMYKYAIRIELVERNPLRDIDYSQLNYKPENDCNDDIYSIEDRVKIMEYLSDKDDLVSLAIQLDFCLIARIGEIKALKWSDIDYEQEVIRIQRQYLTSQEVNDDLSFQKTKHYHVDYTKGKTKLGFRYLPLTPNALEILERIKKVNPNNDFLFIQENDIPITTTKFNRRLIAICKELNIPYRSSHKIRFCAASLLYENGIAPTVIQGLLGHTTLSMTLHYLRNVKSKKEVFEQVKKVLN